MESKKAKFSVFLVVALLAIICSSSLYAFTGGFSDWIVNSPVNEDENNNGIIDSAENDNSNYYDENGGYNDDGGLFGFFSNSDDSSDGYDYYSSDSSSSDNPDLFARILRGIMNSGNSIASGYEQSNDYDDNSVPVSDYDFSSLSDYADGEDFDYSDTIDRGFNKFSQKIDSYFY